LENKFEAKNGKLFINGKEVLKGWESFSGWYWFATEKIQVQEDEFSDHDQIWFGLVQGLEEEWGDFAQAEIEALGKSKVWEIPAKNLEFSGRRN